MKTKDYRAILQAIEKALEVCDQSSEFMDDMHLDICRELRATRARLLRLIGSFPDPGAV